MFLIHTSGSSQRGVNRVDFKQNCTNLLFARLFAISQERRKRLCCYIFELTIESSQLMLFIYIEVSTPDTGPSRQQGKVSVPYRI